MNFTIFIVVTLFLTTNPSILRETNGTVDKPALIPEELSRFLLELGTVNKDILGWQESTKKPNYYVASLEVTTELSDDETRLKTRKVWSRWGKWSECSVTCGSGVMSRQRVCLEGSCAPDEHERQCRPCTRNPCGADADRTLSDDPHDLE